MSSPRGPVARKRSPRLVFEGVDGAPTGFDALLVQDLLERVSELEATYHLNSKLWGYPQLRKTRYWDRGKIWVVIDQMCHIREAEAAFRALSGRSPPKARSLLNDASLRLSAWNLKSHDKLATAPPEASGSGSGLSSLPVEPHALPRASATKFLTSYYLSLSQIRDSLKQWRTEL
ncbi:hypothetical protein CspeluHIS016_0108040 [Cutaneotrichosporon spelunceum]|uniref:Uncharacterized protein n=1 Tax=Cutaneotrichosporon spelunceum TaxID=1672016 RepID=A0AAD3Y9P9_9TREE|nr:hypothetical protein CspeluHIS016_0108040 [Cutaneotrichosporon spelunceum]